MKCLLEVAHIKLTLPRLLIVLERLVPLSSDTVAACLQEDSSKWELISTQSSGLEELNG
jgi:hypothetical protein